MQNDNVSLSGSTEEFLPMASSIVKKRKLEYDQNDSCLPSPKHKLRERQDFLDVECSRTESIGFDCTFTDEGSAAEFRCNAEEQESGQDSNSIMEESNGDIGFGTEERIAAKRRNGKTLIWDIPSTSSSASNNALSSSTLASRTCNRTRTGKGTKQYYFEDVEVVYNSMTGLDNVHETCDDQIFAELMKKNMDGLKKGNDDAMLYSNGVNDFLLSQNLQDDMQDFGESAKKLTIDQEFEQYFSMLML